MSTEEKFERYTKNVASWGHMVDGALNELEEQLQDSDTDAMLEAVGEAETAVDELRLALRLLSEAIHDGEAVTS